MARVACANVGSLRTTYVRRSLNDTISTIENTRGPVDFLCVQECQTYTEEIAPHFGVPFAANVHQKNEKTRGVCTYVSNKFSGECELIDLKKRFATYKWENKSV